MAVFRIMASCIENHITRRREPYESIYMPIGVITLKRTF